MATQGRNGACACASTDRVAEAASLLVPQGGQQSLRLRAAGAVFWAGAAAQAVWSGHEKHQMHSQPLLAARRLIPVNLVTQLEGPDVALLSIRTQTGTFFNYDIMIY